MRSSHWQYLAYVLIGVGSSLSISGLIAFIYFQQRPAMNPQYQPFTIPLLFAGVCIIAVGILTFRQAIKKRRHEIEGEKPPMYLPPPPPPPPPPPLT